MKKLFLTTAILLSVTIGGFAQYESKSWSLRNLFGTGEEYETEGLGTEQYEINENAWDDQSESSNFSKFGGLFMRGENPNTGVGSNFRGDNLFLPGEHGMEADQNGSPLGSGIAVLMGLGAAYLVGKRRKED